MEIKFKKCTDCDGKGSYLFRVRTVQIDQKTKEIIHPRNPGSATKEECDNCDGKGFVKYEK